LGPDQPERCNAGRSAQDSAQRDPSAHTDEAKLFLGTIAGDPLEALYTVAIACGLRQGEALGLTWDDVNLESRTLSVRRALQRVDGKLTFVETKTEKSRRTIVLPMVATARLAAHHERQTTQCQVAGEQWQESSLVFTTSIGTPLDRHNVTRNFQRLLARLGLPRQRFHDLRHGCASLLFAQGLSAKEVIETLGHSQISTTADLYGHMFDSRRREIADRMDDALRTRVPDPFLDGVAVNVAVNVAEADEAASSIGVTSTQW
jgi:integrase